MSLSLEINAATGKLKEISSQRITDEYYDQIREMSPFERQVIDNELAEAMRTIIGIRKDIDKVRVERYLNEQVSDQKGSTL